VRKRAQRVTNVVRARFQPCRNASRDSAAFAVSASASLLTEAAEDQMPNSPKFLLENEINRSVAPTQHASNSLTRATAGLEPNTRHLKPVTFLPLIESPPIRNHTYPQWAQQKCHF
jgi:hypothetical protein